jgi:hypothetical protein
MKTFEIFTEGFSRIVQADDIVSALNWFHWDNQEASDVIMIVDKAFPDLLNSVQGEILEDIDLELSQLEDYLHGEEGKKITALRAKIQSNHKEHN